MAVDEGFVQGILCHAYLFDTTKAEKRLTAELMFFFSPVIKGSIIHECVAE